jgi:hypothetical protein
MDMTNYGSNIKFKGEHKGYKKGAKYKWIASAHLEYPDTVFLHKHDAFWLGESLNFIIERMAMIIPHECIHQILWDYGEDPNFGYDIVRGRIIHKRNISQYLKNIYYRMT